MDTVLALRPFVPARDFDLSRRFYQGLGFAVTHQHDTVAGLKLASFSFILRNFYVKDHGCNFMMRLMVRDADAWWRAADDAALGPLGRLPGRCFGRAVACGRVGVLGASEAQ